MENLGENTPHLPHPHTQAHFRPKCVLLSDFANAFRSPSLVRCPAKHPNTQRQKCSETTKDGRRNLTKKGTLTNAAFC